MPLLRRCVGNSFDPAEKEHSNVHKLLVPKKVEQENEKHVPLTIAQRTPSVEAMMVAARGMLYMSANSPNDPLPSYEPTLRSSPSIVTKMSNLPLQQASEVNTGIRFD